MTHTQSEDNMTSGWKSVKLGELITIKHGFAFKGEYITTEDNGIVLVTPGNFAIGGGFQEGKKFFNGEYPSDYVLRPGELIVTMTDLSKDGDTLGYSALVPETNRTYLHNQRIGLIEVHSNEISKDYLYWFMRTRAYQKQVVATASGSTVRHTSPSRICEIEISLPPLDVQRKIAAVLKPLDDKIEINARVNARLERVAQALFKRHFVRFEPYGGTMPPGWRVGTIGEIITPKRGKNLLSKDAIAGDVPVVAGGLEPSVYHNTANTKAPVVTISGSGANAGFVRLWMRDVWSSDSSFIDSTMSEDVFFWYVLLKSRQEEIYGAQTGSAQPHIYPKNIAEMKCIIPAAEAIKEYCDLVSPMFEKIGLNTDESRTLARLRDVLLPRLMSGAVDVRQVRLNTIQKGGSR